MNFKTGCSETVVNTIHSGISPTFGTIIKSRVLENQENYRFGFASQEKTDEISGNGNHNTAEFWEYDSRLGRRWNRDPIYNPSLSDYAAFANNPILFTDKNGDTLSISLFRYVPFLFNKESLTHKLEDLYLPFSGYYDRNRGTVFVKTAETYIKKQVDDNVFAIFGHGSPYGIDAMNPDGSVIDFSNNPKGFVEYLASKNPALQKAITEKNPITLVLYSCETGSDEYISSDGTKFKVPTSFAKQITKMYSFITVVAPNGAVDYGKDSKGNYTILGVDDAHGPGEWRTFKNGEMVGKPIPDKRKTGTTKGKSGSSGKKHKTSHTNVRYL